MKGNINLNLVFSLLSYKQVHIIYIDSYTHDFSFTSIVLGLKIIIIIN